MSYKIFLDDERTIQMIYPNALNDEFKLAKDKDEFNLLIETYGMPNFISFDHDLGTDEFGNIKETGFNVAQVIVQNDLDGEMKIPNDFNFKVHSSNPAGRENIIGLLDNYLNFLKST